MALATFAGAALSLGVVLAVPSGAPARVRTATGRERTSAFVTRQATRQTASRQTVSTHHRWTPKPRAQWQWQLSSTPTEAQLTSAYAAGARAFDIDGGDASAATVTAIHRLGPHVGAVCYIDVGGWENYRPDAGSFPKSVLGRTVDGWPAERWLDIRKLSILLPLMAKRIHMCRAKGFDAVEPDLLDGYENDSGFPLTGAEQLRYDEAIAARVHSAGMSVIQKGDVDQAAQLEPSFDWTLNEQCGQYHECGALRAYTKAGKAVWIVEYQGFPKVCSIDYPIAGSAAMYKSLDLTATPRKVCTSWTAAARRTTG